MKRTDIAALVFVASTSMIIAYFIATPLIGGPVGEPTKVKTIDPITTNIIAPDPSIFNENAINPTVEIVIGDNQ